APEKVDGKVPAKVSPLRVLVVEDNPDNRLTMRSLLRFDGHDVTLAKDGLEGLATFERGAFDAALIDVGLPGIDGLELARRIRQKGTEVKTLLAALTGYGRDEDRAAVLDAGFDVHLVKPIVLEDLQRVLANVKRDCE